jgi:hypothetical protein
MMVFFSLVAAGIACATDSQALPPEASLQDAQALAQAMHVEKFVKEAFEAVVESNIKSGRATQAELNCIKRTDIPFANDVYASAMARALTQEEMSEALTFFNKPAGQWFLEYSKNLDFQARGLASSIPDVEMTEEMYADFAKFIRGTASKKLLETREHETPELKNALGAKIMPIFLRCKQQGTAQPDAQR